MKRMTPIRYGLVAALMVIVSLGAVAGLKAQEPPEPPPDGELPDPPAREEMTEAERHRIQERIRIMRAWQLTEALELDETTAIQLFDFLDERDVAQEEAQVQLRTSSRELRQLLESGEGSDERVAELLEQIISTHLSIEEMRASMVRDASSILSPRQQAGLMLFLPEFDRRIQQMVRQVRRERRQGGDEPRPRRDRRPPPGPPDE